MLDIYICLIWFRLVLDLPYFADVVVPRVGPEASTPCTTESPSIYIHTYIHTKKSCQVYNYTYIYMYISTYIYVYINVNMIRKYLFYMNDM